MEVQWTVDSPDVLEQRFETRTRKHILLVGENIDRYCSAVGLSNDDALRMALQQRAMEHDASKWSQFERPGYVILTEKHRIGRVNESLGDSIDKLVAEAIRTHKARNRHHPEYHTAVDDMDDVDLIEMVCDWAAINQELSGKASPRPYWNDVAKTKYGFSSHKAARIEQIIAVLESDETNSL